MLKSESIKPMNNRSCYFLYPLLFLGTVQEFEFIKSDKYIFSVAQSLGMKIIPLKTLHINTTHITCLHYNVWVLLTLVRNRHIIKSYICTYDIVCVIRCTSSNEHTVNRNTKLQIVHFAIADIYRFRWNKMKKSISGEGTQNAVETDQGGKKVQDLWLKSKYKSIYFQSGRTAAEVMTLYVVPGNPFYFNYLLLILTLTASSWRRQK